MALAAHCRACGSATDSADDSAGQYCPQCGASLSTNPDVYDAEIIPLDEASIVAPESDDALLIKDDDLVGETGAPPDSNVDPDDPMAFLKSLEPPPVEGRRRCPNCRHYIQPTAIRCRHCHIDTGSWERSEPAAAPARDLSLAERQLMKSYRGGTKLIIGYCVAMIFAALLYAFAYSLDFDADGQANEDAAGLSLLFAMCWAICACFCCANGINAIRFVGLLCALDLIWMIMDLNPIGLLTSGIMLWVVVGTTSKAEALRKRGILLSLTGQPVVSVRN